MGFEEGAVETLFDITAGLVHMGELEFESQEGDEGETVILDDSEENT